MKPALPSSLKEERTHGSELFHFGYYTADASADSFFVAPHWHEEIEIVYFQEGHFILEANMERYPIVVQSPRLSSLRTCLHFYPMMPHRDGCSDRLQTIHCCCRAASIQQIPALDRCFLNTRK